MGQVYTATVTNYSSDEVDISTLTHIDYNPPLKDGEEETFGFTMPNGKVLDLLKNERDRLPEGDSLRIVVDRDYGRGMSRYPQRVTLLQGLREEEFEVVEE
jgi:hypothetical protein